MSRVPVRFRFRVFLLVGLIPFPSPLVPQAMSSTVPINQLSDITAPTPQNTPLTHAPISAGLSRPTVPDISEDAEPAEEAGNVHDAVVGLVQGRLAGLLGKSSGYIESLPDGAKKTLEALKGVQVRQNDLQNQYKRECLELEKKVESRVFHMSHVPSFSFPFASYPSTPPPLPSLFLPDRKRGEVRIVPHSRCGLGSRALPFMSRAFIPSPIALDPKSETIDVN
jgi:hypothetical protein